MTTFYNGTQHEINIYSFLDCDSVQNGRKLVLKAGVTPVAIIPAGNNLNAVKGNLPAPELETDIPVKGAVVFTSYEAAPEGFEVYIVSNLYRSAVKELGGDTSKLATVDGVVYASEADMKPCGCTALAIG
jgi:hypothetical protein